MLDFVEEDEYFLFFGLFILFIFVCLNRLLDRIDFLSFWFLRFGLGIGKL